MFKVCRIVWCQTHWILNHQTVILFRYWTVQEILGFVSPLLGASQVESMCLILVTFHWAQKKQLQACCVLLRSPSLLCFLMSSSNLIPVIVAYSPLHMLQVCGNLDPATINYDQRCLRPHFLKCLKKSEFESFPAEPQNRTPDLLSEIHFEFIASAVCQTGVMIWFSVNSVVNGTILLVLLLKPALWTLW